MTEDDWARLKTLFTEALEKPVADRPGFVAEACADAPALRAELETLLAHHDQATDFLEEPVRDLGLTLSLTAPEPGERRIGSYQVVREIARGGMGTVYLAERADDQFQQRVALKVIRRGMDTEEVLRRFLAERQILARLEHPNIARLLDGGLTDEDRPYFVMEYVEGVPIHHYCRRRGLAVDARIRLFRQVCDAVHYAHQNLVIHRDLKPSNILVSADGVVKLLDFGIARVLSDDDHTDASLTRVGQQLLTVAYASPEQVRREPLTTASDVYSLGVLLYELLTGVRPYDTSGLSPAEVERVVCETRPTRPSSAALGAPEKAAGGQAGPAPAAPPDGARPGQDGPGPGAERGARLGRRLRGDLDTIVLEALRKEPERRYPSVKQLSDDLALHLAGRPITARADSWSYRTGKFVQRHRWGTAAAAAFTLLLTAGAIALAAQSVRIARERDRATQVSSLLIDVFQSSDPRVAGADTVTARQLLDRGVDRVRALEGQDPVKASLLDVMGLAYHSLGLYSQAGPLLEEALALKEDAYGPDHPETAASLNALGNLHQVRGELDQAEPLLRRALDVRERHLDDPSPELAQSLNNLSQLLLARRDFQAAEPMLLRAVEMQRALSPDPHADLAQGLNNLGLLYHLQGRYEEAVPFYQESLDMQRQVLGSPHPDVAQTTNNLALVLQSLGRYDQAEPLHAESLEMRRALLGPEHPRVVVGLNNLGLLLFEMGRHPEADSLYRQALTLGRRVIGPTHPQTAIVLNNLADVRRAVGDLPGADSLYRASLDIRLETLGPQHPHVAYSLNGMALLRQAQGRLEAADSLFASAVERRRAALGPEHPDLAVSLHGWGMVKEARGDTAAAEARLREALGIREAALPAGHPRTAETLLGLGELLTRTRRAAQAEPLLEQALEIRTAAFGPNHPWTDEARVALERCRAARRTGGG